MTGTRAKQLLVTTTQARYQKFFRAGEVYGLGHFQKPFVKCTRKKVPQGNFLELFLLDTLKTKFWMGDSTQGWTQGLFFQNQGTSFDFQKRAGKASPSPLVVCLPPSTENTFQIFWNPSFMEINTQYSLKNLKNWNNLDLKCHQLKIKGKKGLNGGNLD